MSEKTFLKDFRPKKYLGQVFLVDNNIINKIINACCITKKDTILEIGAGAGNLTSRLAERARFVFALEIDKELCSLLRKRIEGFNNVKIINKDVLNFSLSGLIPQPKKNLKVVANIPYYISTPIIEYLLINRKFFKEIFITIQKELARRILAKPDTKDYSSLSCFVQFYTEPKGLFLIKRNSFLPKPEVDSIFLKLDVFQKPRFKLRDEKFLFKLIRTAFSMRRKNILNSLEQIVPKDRLKDYLSYLGIDHNLRPENLSLEDFIRIANLLQT